MPLPTISTVAQKTAGGLKTIKERFGTTTQEPPKEAPAQPSTSAPSRSAPSQNSANNPISRVVNPTRNRSATSAAGTSAFSKNQEANEKAIEKSRGGTNPLIPLIQNVNSTLIRNR